MQEDKQKSLKDYIRHRKDQLKSVKGKQLQTEQLTKFIENGDLQNFQKSFSSLQKEQVVIYLFTEDLMKTTSLLRILESGNLVGFLTAAINGLKREWSQIKEKICDKWEENKLVANEWRGKFSTLNKGVTKLIYSMMSNQQKGKEFAQFIVNQFSEQNNFISELYRKFLTVDSAFTHFPIQIKYAQNFEEFAQVLQLFYIPLCDRIFEQPQRKLYQHYKGLKEAYVKEVIWYGQDFTKAMEKGRLNPYNFELKEINLNFMHVYFQNNAWKHIQSAQELVLKTQSTQLKKLHKKAHSSFNPNDQTPIDIALKKWPTQLVQGLFSLIGKNPEIMRLSVNSLNLVINNPNLQLKTRQNLINKILDDQFSSRGYIASIKMDKHVQKNLSSNQGIFHMYLSTSEFSSMMVYDVNELLGKQYRESYPLLAYLHWFKQQSSLEIVKKLFINNILDRKSSKLKIMSTLKCFYKVKGITIQEKSEGHRHLQEISFYHTPLLNYITHLPPCQVIQYLLDKLFINCPSIQFKKNNHKLEICLGRHFLVVYLQNAPSLTDNDMNNLILSKVFDSKQSQRFIDSRYNMYVQILRGLNRSFVFRVFKVEYYMIRRVRSYLRQYFDSLSAQELFESDYFKELSFWFFQSYLGRKTNRKKQKKNTYRSYMRWGMDEQEQEQDDGKYSLQKDWCLYNADQICQKVKQLNLEKFLIPQPNWAFPQDQLKLTSQQKNDLQVMMKEKRKIAKIINSHLKGSDYDQVKQVQYPSFDKQSVQWFKARYHQYRSYNSLSKYIQKINFQLNKVNAYPSLFLSTNVEISLTEKQLDYKIQLLLREGFDFYLPKIEVQSIRMDSYFKSYPQVRREPINDPILSKVVERMIDSKASFIKTLLHCQQIECNQLDYFWKKDRQLFVRKLMGYFKYRNAGKHLLTPKFSYPYDPVEPIPFHVFINVKWIVQEGGFEQYREDVSIERLLDNFLMNLESKVIWISQSDNIKFKKEQIDKCKEEAVLKLVSLWEKGYKYIKSKLNYKQLISVLVQQQLQKGNNISLEGKKEQNMEENENNGNASQVESMEQHAGKTELQYLKDFFELIGQKLLKKYHKNGFQLTKIFNQLTPQDVFLIDSYTGTQQNSNLMLVYQMEASQTPYQVFCQRLEIQPLLKPLAGKKQHAKIRSIFIKQLQRFTLQQFSTAIKKIEEKHFIPIGDILHQINDEEKMITLLNHLLVLQRQEAIRSEVKADAQVLEYKKVSQKKQGSSQKGKKDKAYSKIRLSPLYLVGLINEDMPLLTTCIALVVDKNEFEFRIKEQSKKGVSPLICDNVTFYSKCSMDTFKTVLQLIQKYYNRESKYLSPRIINYKIIQIVSALVQSQSWDRLLNLLSLSNFDNLQPMVEAAFESIGESIESARNQISGKDKIQQLEKVIEKCFEIYQQLKFQFNDQTFVNAYKCNPSKSFQIMQPKQLTVEGFVNCLKSIPQQAKLFLTYKIQVNIQKKPQPSYFKSNFPLTPYYFYKFGDCPWLLDLLRMERRILSAVGQVNRLDKTMESLILLEKMEDNFGEFYTEEEIQLKCSKVLSSTLVTSIKKYPKEWFDNYLQKHSLKNLSILTEELLKQLIDMEYINREDIIKVISTCKMEVVKHFCSKHSMTIDAKTISEIEKKYLPSKYSQNLWEYLTQIQNESFVVQFIKTYKLFDILLVESYESVLLNNIALYKKLILLNYVIEYFTHKAGRALQFVFNIKGKIRNYLITLPQEISITMNFYEYLFLVRACNNQCPDFYTSNRFLIEAENNIQLMQTLNFVPQLKKRLEIMHLLAVFVPLNQGIIWKRNILMKNLLQLKSNQKDEKIKQEDAVNAKWQKFLTYLVNPSAQVFHKKPLGTLGQVLVLYVARQKIKIDLKQLQQLYPLELKVLNSVDKYINKEIDLSSQAFSVINADSQLKSVLLISDFSLFMQHYQNQLKLLISFEDAILYLKGVLLNLKAFQKDEKYKNLLSRFLSVCFSQLNGSYLLDSNYSLYLKKNVLEYFIVSYCQGTQFTLNYLSQLLHIQKQQPGKILFLAASKANEVSIRGKLSPTFDIRAWNNIIEEISQLKSPLNSNRTEFPLSRLIESSIQSLQLLLLSNYNSTIINLRQLIKQSIKKAEENLKENVFITLTLLINQTYILSVFHQFYTSIKQALKQDQKLSLNIQFVADKFDVKISQQNQKQILFVLPYEWNVAHHNIPLLQVNMDDVLGRSERQISLYNLGKNPQIQVLSKKYQNSPQSSFRNLKFYFEVELFKKVNNWEALRKLIECTPMTDNGVSLILNMLDDLDVSGFDNKSIRYYSFSDVYGPIRLCDEDVDYERVADCLTFYQMLQLPMDKVIIQLIEKKPSQGQVDERCSQDFAKYLQFVTNELRDAHPYDKCQYYNFSNRIQLFIDQTTLHITPYTHHFSLFNILNCLTLINIALDQVRRTFQYKLDVRFNPVSIMDLYNYLTSIRKQQQQGLNHFLKHLLRGKQLTKLLNLILLMMIEDATKIMKVLKGTLITFQIPQDSSWQLNPQQLNTTTKSYKIYHSIYVTKITYKITDQLLSINFLINIVDKDNEKDKQSKIESESDNKVNQDRVQESVCGLVSRSEFLSSIFESNQFLTDYFLQTNQINTQCIKVSRTLTNKLNKTINLHLNYKSLYKYIESVKQQSTIKEIDSYLKTLRVYLLANMQQKLIDYSSSQFVLDSHQLMLINTFELLQKKVNQKEIVDTKTIENEVKVINNQKELTYAMDQKHNDKGLQLIDGYSQNIKDINDTAKNVFLIQIYKSYFTTLVSQGMTFVIGFKQTNKNPIMIKFLKRQDIDKINLVQIAYILLISQQIPTNDQLDRNKIIRIFLTDLHLNVYKVSQPIKQFLLSLSEQQHDLRNISDLLPVIPSNIAIDFNNQTFIPNNLKLTDKTDLKVFEIKLEQKPKFKLIPSQEHPIHFQNFLKKNHLFNQQIDNFIHNINKTWGKTNLKLVIETLQVPQKTNFQKITQIVQNSLFDIEAALNSYLSQSSRNPELQTIFSIYLDQSIKENVFIQLRKKLFLSHFQILKIVVSQTQQPSIKVNGQQIILEISCSADQKIVNQKDIVFEILQYLVKLELQQFQKELIIDCGDYEKLSIIQLLRIIDILNTLRIQLQEIQKAKRLYDLLNLAGTFKDATCFLRLQPSRKSSISYVKLKNKLKLYLNISNSYSEFFTASHILMAFMNDFDNELSTHQNQVSYDPQSKRIRVDGKLSEQFTLIIEKDQKLQKLQKTIFVQNQSGGEISIEQILMTFNPNHPIRFWVIEKNRQVHQNFIYHLPSSTEVNSIDKKINSTLTNQQISLYVKNQNQPINIHTCPITMSILQSNQNIPHTYQSILRQDFKHFFEIKMISRETAMIKFTFQNSANISINLGGFKNVLDDSNTQIYQVSVSSNRQVVIENTRFVEVHFRGKVHQSKQIKSSQRKRKQKDRVFIEPAQKSSQQQMEQIQAQKIKKDNIQSLVYVVNNQSKNYLTRAGQRRIDYIELCDADHNPIQYKGQLNIYFKHVNNLCRITPQIQRKGLKIGLAWTPSIRGHYKVYFSNICLNPDYEIGVCAAVADPKLSIVQKPKLTKISFFEETQCTFNFKDSYGNIYTELEQSIMGDGLLIDVETDNAMINKYLKKKEESINKYGVKRLRLSFDNSNQADPVKTIVSVSLNKQQVCQFQLQVEGLSLSQRRKNLQKDIHALNKGYYKDITVSRNNFMEDLFKIAQKSLLTNFSVKFAGQQGIDAGGLKRQFYDMIGNEIKNEKNPFFKPTDSRKNFYFINAQILKNKKKESYMQLLGKYLANSILNSYLIGVNFSTVFIKLLYNDPIDFEDLLQVIPNEQVNRYKYLTYAPPEDFEDLEMYFTTIVDRKKGLEVELKQDGANIQVTHENVKEYLHLLTKILVQERYQEVIEAFRKGFETVIPLSILQRWIRPHEFWCLTQGTKQINAQMVLNYIVFSGSVDQSVSSWFRRYIKEANLQVLEGFLKFSNGSSSIDFDQTSKITVTFENAGSNCKKLPISHTCWKQIVVPKYKSYEIMHKLLNAAFIFCSEGFGFG